MVDFPASHVSFRSVTITSTVKYPSTATVKKNTESTVEISCQTTIKTKLVGGWTTHPKNMLVKLDHFPNFQGEN